MHFRSQESSVTRVQLVTMSGFQVTRGFLLNNNNSNNSNNGWGSKAASLRQETERQPRPAYPTVAWGDRLGMHGQQPSTTWSGQIQVPKLKEKYVYRNGWGSESIPIREHPNYRVADSDSDSEGYMQEKPSKKQRESDSTAAKPGGSMGPGRSAPRGLIGSAQVDGLAGDADDDAAGGSNADPLPASFSLASLTMDKRTKTSAEGDTTGVADERFTNSEHGNDKNCDESKSSRDAGPPLSTVATGTGTSNMSVDETISVSTGLRSAWNYSSSNNNNNNNNDESAFADADNEVLPGTVASETSRCTKSNDGIQDRQSSQQSTTSSSAGTPVSASTSAGNQNPYSGHTWLPGLTAGVPKARLNSWYGEAPRRQQLGKEWFVSWANGAQPHQLRFSCVFVCPLTAEIFPAGRYGQDTGHSVDGNNVVWYTQKKQAEHGAAARAYDCFSYRQHYGTDIQATRLGLETPYLSQQGAASLQLEWTPPVLPQWPPDVDAKIQALLRKVDITKKVNDINHSVLGLNGMSP